MKKFKLQDLMTSDQALEILDYLESLETRIIDLEKQVSNLKNAQSELNWKDINLQTEIYKIYKGD